MSLSISAIVKKHCRQLQLTEEKARKKFGFSHKKNAAKAKDID